MAGRLALSARARLLHNQPRAADKLLKLLVHRVLGVLADASQSNS